MDISFEAKAFPTREARETPGTKREHVGAWHDGDRRGNDVVGLMKGQSVRVETAGGSRLAQVTMRVGWDVRRPSGLRAMFEPKPGDIDLAASCLLFDAAGQAVDSVWFRQLRSRDGSVVHGGTKLSGENDGADEAITIDLTRVPVTIAALMFTVSSFRGDRFDRIDSAFCRLVDDVGGHEVGRFDLSGSGPHSGQVMARLRRGGADWEFTALGARTSGRTFHDMMPTIVAAL